MKGQTVEQRFFDKVAWSDSRWGGTRCLEFTGARSTGYGLFHVGMVDGQRVRGLAHRWIYERWVGPIPEGYEVDHLCRNRSCVNALHLEAVTPTENKRRSNAPSGTNARKTHCKYGHELVGENVAVTIRNGLTRRRCRTCSRIDVERQREKKRGGPPRRRPWVPDETVLEIRHRGSTGESQGSIAVALGVSQSFVSNVLRGRVRADVQSQADEIAAFPEIRGRRNNRKAGT